MTVREYIESLRPYIGVRGYRMLLRTAVAGNVLALAEIAIADSIDRGGAPIEFEIPD